MIEDNISLTHIKIFVN